MRTKLSTIWLYIIAAFILHSCQTLPVKDITVWSFIGEGADPSRPTIAALGSHSNFVKHEYMTLDEWVNFLAASEKEKRGPAICISAADFNKQKTVVDQACKKVNCSYEQQKAIENLEQHVATSNSFKKGIK